MALAIYRESPEQLRAVIKKHQVCFQIWPEQLIVKGQRLQVGFQLELCGIHEPGAEPKLPGCENCYHVYEDLRRIAEWVKPQEARPSRCEIEPFDHALHVIGKSNSRFEVILTMKLLHRQGIDEPLDKCQELCLKEMRQKLAKLGVREGRL
jgi:hypothetical protein